MTNIPETTLEAKLNKITQQWTEAKKSDGTRLFAQVHRGPIRDMEAVTFPYAEISLARFDFQVIVYIPVNDMAQSEKDAVLMRDSIAESLNFNQPSFGAQLCQGKIYRTLRYYP